MQESSDLLRAAVVETVVSVDVAPIGGVRVVVAEFEEGVRSEAFQLSWKKGINSDCEEIVVVSPSSSVLVVGSVITSFM